MCRDSFSPEIIITRPIIIAVQLERNKEAALMAALEQWYIIFGKSAHDRKTDSLSNHCQNKERNSAVFYVQNFDFRYHRVSQVIS